MRISNEILDARIEYLENEYNFDESKGWNQVNNKGEAINRKYGEYRILIAIKNGYLK